MPSDKNEKKDRKQAVNQKKDRAEEIANTLEWLITAFILAFVFRAFVIEAFRIPTGSMADTLKGAHFRLCCKQCGYTYDYGFIPASYGLPEDTIPTGTAAVPVTRCPNCGCYHRSNELMPVANGDRILVLKCIYQFIEPKRWDVVVFKNPTNPTINYIKRLIGTEGETVEIIDGDVYINGKISRKPLKVQKELWMPVYNNDYQPIEPYLEIFNGHSWKQPFAIDNFSQWKIDPSRPTEFILSSDADDINKMTYDSSIGNDFRTAYAYDSVTTYQQMPMCSDLMMKFYCTAKENTGRIGITLGKYLTDYSGWIDFQGQMVIEKNINGETVELARKTIPPSEDGQSPLKFVQFSNVDHMLTLQYGREKLAYDLGTGRNDAGTILKRISPKAEIFGSGKLTISHIALYRDTHYMEAYRENGPYGRATEDHPLILGKNEFFVLGDNSPNSEDGRWWTKEGIPNKGLPPYRTGIVPRDYLVGKALFVYWPSGFRPFPEFPFGIIPNIGKLKLIYGGSSKEYQ